MLMSWSSFNIMMSVMLVSLALGWTIYDARKLLRVLRSPPGETIHEKLARRDLIFGSVVGVLLAAFGGLGAAKFYLW